MSASGNPCSRNCRASAKGATGFSSSPARTPPTLAGDSRKMRRTRPEETREVNAATLAFVPAEELGFDSNWWTMAAGEIADNSAGPGKQAPVAAGKLDWSEDSWTIEGRVGWEIAGRFAEAVEDRSVPDSSAEDRAMTGLAGWDIAADTFAPDNRSADSAPDNRFEPVG